MTEPRPPKKSDTLEVRMPHEAKRAFIEACRKDGRTASGMVRDFVEGYLARGAASERFLWDPSKSARSLLMTLRSHPILLKKGGRRGVFAAGVGALALIGLSVSPSVAEIDFRAMFDRLDVDLDGKVTLEEFATPPAPHGDVMFFSLERTQTVDDGAETGVTEEAQSFWLPVPAPPDAAAPAQGVNQEIRIVRRMENGELVTEEVEALPNDIADLRSHEFAQFDENTDGAVDYAEFEGRNRAMMENTFNRIDADGSGKLSAAEMEAIPTVLLSGFGGAAPPPTPSPYDERAFGALDRNGDGGVSLDEFAAGPATP